MKSSGEVAEAYLAIGEQKCAMSVWKLLLSGMFAGAFIALGALGSQIASIAAEGPMGRLLSALVFPVGLAMVVATGTELFTGDCLLAIPLLERRVGALQVLRCLTVVYLGNLFGGVLVAELATYSRIYELFNGALLKTVLLTAYNKVTLSFGDMLLRGILCNVLVCVAVWMGLAARDAAGRLIGLYLPVMLFVLCGFEHSVANMYFIPAGIFSGSLYGAHVATAVGLLRNLIAVTIGNIIGGAVFVGAGFRILYAREDI